VLSSGIQLATASGDTTVKIWDFANASCIQTFADHQRAGMCVFSVHLSHSTVTGKRLSTFFVHAK